MAQGKFSAGVSMSSVAGVRRQGRSRRLLLAAATASLSAIGTSPVLADGDFNILMGAANKTWETDTWTIGGDTGGQAYPGDPNGDGTESAFIGMNNSGRTMLLGGVTTTYNLASLNLLQSQNNGGHTLTLQATTPVTINTNLITHADASGISSNGGGQFLLNPDTALNLTVVATNLKLIADQNPAFQPIGVPGPFSNTGNLIFRNTSIRFNEVDLTFTGITLEGAKGVEIENATQVGRWNFSGNIEHKGVERFRFRYFADGVSGDLVDGTHTGGTSNLGNLRANNGGNGYAPFVFDRASGTVINRFVFNNTILDSDLYIDPNNTHLSLGTIQVNGDRKFWAYDGLSAALTANGSDFTEIVGLAGSAITFTGTSTVSLNTANTQNMLGNIAVADYTANLANPLSATSVGIAKVEGRLNLDHTPDALATSPLFVAEELGIISGSNAQLSALTRGVNVTLNPGAIVGHESNSAASVSGTGTIQGLGTSADLYFGLSTDFTQNLSVGTGTPWKGFGNDRSQRRWHTATVSTSSNFEVALTGNANLLLGNAAGAGNGFTIDTGGQARTMTAVGRGTLILDDAENSFANLTIQAGANTVVSFLSQGVDGSRAAIVALQDGTVDLRNSAAIDGPVSIQSGGILRLDDAFGMNGTGTITQQAGAIVRITNAGGIVPASGVQQSLGTVPGTIIRMEANDINGLDANVDDGAIYVVTGADRTQAAGITIGNGGVLTQDGSGRSYNNSAAGGALNTITIGSGGAVIASSSNPNVTGGVDLHDLNINAEIAGAGQHVDFNSLSLIDGREKLGDVKVHGKVRLGSATTVAGRVVFNNADTNILGDLVVNTRTYLGGGGESNNQGNLTDRFITTSTDPADRVAGNIIINDQQIVEMGLQSPVSGRLDVSQPFTINGLVDPTSKRRLYISRRTGSVALGVNLNNIILNAGSEFGVDEDNTDVRAKFHLAGNATAVMFDTIDLDGVARAASAPAYNGSNPLTLDWGRVGDGSLNSNVRGTIEAGTEVNIIRGQLYFQDDAVINGVVRTQTAPAGGDSFIQIRGGASGSNFVSGTGWIEGGFSGAANGSEDIKAYVDDAPDGSPQIVNFVNVGIRVVNDGIDNNTDARIQADRNGADDLVNGKVVYRLIHILAGARGDLQESNSITNSLQNLIVETGGIANLDGTTGDIPLHSLRGGGSVTQNSTERLTLGTNSGLADLLAPGDSIGTITVDKLTLDDGFKLLFEGDETTGDLANILDGGGFTITGGLASTATVETDFLGATATHPGQYVLFSWTGADPAGPDDGVLAGWTVTGEIEGTVLYSASTDQILLDVTAVPEPTAMALVAMAGAGLLSRRRRN